MLNNLKKYSVILGSQSPRRRELLANIGVDFVSKSLNVNEVFPSDLKREEIPLFLSNLKAKSYVDLNKNELLITSDTIVWHRNSQLGKPKGEKEAFEVLSQLSGSINEVITAVTLKTIEKAISFYEVTEVHFNMLSTEEIEHYIYQYKPFDKAGAYGIQEWIGQIGINKINGDYYNVMGLPTSRLYTELKRL